MSAQEQDNKDTKIIQGKLSVVIIGKNVEEYLQVCLRSVVEACTDACDEIIYVDSRSTDNSIEIAKGFDIRIIRIKQGNIMTPSAGRYLGFKHTTGEYILFIDGDMILNKEWVKIGLDILDKERSIQVVTGTGKEKRGSEYVDIMSEETGYVESAYGAYMVRRKAIEEYALINPYLRGGEEEYMSWIVKHNDGLTYRTTTPIITHLGYKQGYDSRMRRAQYIKGIIQRIKLLPQGLKIMAINKVRKRIMIAVYNVLSVISLLMLPILFYSNRIIFYICLAFILAFPLLILLKKLDLKESILSYIFFYYETYNIILALLEPTPIASKYPTDVEIIK